MAAIPSKIGHNLAMFALQPARPVLKPGGRAVAIALEFPFSKRFSHTA
ncbi:hypothetical protein [Tychonema sp. LEGE 07203]|nr:hypothetical protein [Tychonema sp. LEGE 07203]MBE9096618.1 hypothetical protein [Tychonema sp. LEGE 07203]